MNEFDINMDIHSVRMLHKAVRHYRERWPGGNPEDQQHLTIIELELQKMVLDHQFESE